MSATRIEGCLWHALPENNGEPEKAMDGQRFLQLLSLNGAGFTRFPPLSGMSRRQRYRLVNKGGEGIVCEMSERDGELYLSIQVSQRDLYDALSLISSWLSDRLREAGHTVFLEVEHVKDDQGGVVPGSESSP